MKSMNKISEPDWEAKQVLHLQELEEARARVVQMEKTMRWWSDCTANWREKWSKVRNERNSAREEIKQLQTKLDYAIKESNAYRRQKENLEILNEQMRKELEQIHLLLLKHVDQWGPELTEAHQKVESIKNNSRSYSSHSDDQLDINSKDSGIEEYILNDGLDNANSLEPMEDTLSEISVDIHKDIDELESELTEMKEKYEVSKISKQDVVGELPLSKDTDSSNLMNENAFREGSDRRLADARAQVERLQIENASEWGKRERLETEKLSLERENKKLRMELQDALDRLEKRIKSQPTADNELRSLQLEMSEKNKELHDLKQAHLKLKKTLNDKATELNHSGRRIEQYEAEVKKLRMRIEELKKDLAIAEDEVDISSNNVRKFQRANDDLQEQVDNLQMQVKYLQNRLNSRMSILKLQNRFSDEETDDDDDNT